MKGKQQIKKKAEKGEKKHTQRETEYKNKHKCTILYSTTVSLIPLVQAQSAVNS